jgi:hypothetical protein
MTDIRTDPTRIITSSSTNLDYIVCDTKEKTCDTMRSLKCCYVIILIPAVLGKENNALT